MFCKIFSSQRVQLKIKKVDISHNMIQWESLSRLCGISRSWQSEELVVSVDALYDSTTMRLIDYFTRKLSEGFRLLAFAQNRYLTGRGILFCTYMAEEFRMITVYSNPENCFIQCYHLANCEFMDTFLFYNFSSNTNRIK